MILNSTFCLYNSLCRTARSLRAVPVLQVNNSTFRVLRAAGAHLGGRPDVSPRIDVSAQSLEIWTPDTHLHWQVTDPQVKFLRPFVSSPFLSTIFNKLKVLHLIGLIGHVGDSVIHIGVQYKTPHLLTIALKMVQQVFYRLIDPFSLCKRPLHVSYYNTVDIRQSTL